MFLLIFTFLNLLTLLLSSPIGKRIPKVVNEKLLPPDHVVGAPFEQDGDINHKYHHEVFLGNLVANGTLDVEYMEGYKKLIEIFHKVDKNEDHRINYDELVNWIHDRILEHYEKAEKESDDLFKTVDFSNKSSVTWPEYKALLLGKDATPFINVTEIPEEDKTGEFATQVDHWISADTNEDLILNQQEFLAFVHPEHNKRSLTSMASQMLHAFDKNTDGKLEVEEFAALPPGEVDPDEADLDKEYQEEQRLHFKNMDSNEDGSVDLKELELYLDPRHKQHAEKEASFLLSSSDQNRDGKISEHEMLTHYKLFTGSKFSNVNKLLHDEF